MVTVKKRLGSIDTVKNLEIQKSVKKTKKRRSEIVRSIVASFRERDNGDGVGL
jgi:hypothetical protein